ncbi:1-acyl-sn-glycerol-3-phosphate acyltransferase [Gordonia soli]|uniref:Phospholipid/glycerol acyltransferase domain-containing protein n=1 Tax=Gordonia soli NBRC 108243 TaxID=1223545 RepID=M0QFG7_9ACTN|nr:1-acyl-sn-glycerol-3-phosphate acyltransferase [Gordonia soli]GAC67204.1 hypothetical protein GS4_06_00500 [Gordonia soli NBRC 108243]
MDVELSRVDEVYAHYRQHQQSVRRAQSMYGILAMRHRPRVRYIDDARHELRRVARRSGPPLLIAVNHIRETDPLVLAAAGFLSPLRARIGHMRVLAKDELFVESVQRDKIDALGGIPVFRPKDHEIRAAVAAAQQMFEVCADRMVRGDSIAIFPEGTCNTEEPATVQKLSSGVGHIAVQARNAGADAPQLVAIGLAYPPERGGRAGRPVVVMSSPAELTAAVASTPAAVTRLVADRLQESVSRAYELAER